MAEKGKEKKKKEKKKYYRWGMGPLTIERTSIEAHAAEKALGEGFHGISISTRPSSKGHRSAPIELAHASFKVVKTGGDKDHYTLLLRKPLTQGEIDQFNAVFTPSAPSKRINMFMPQGLGVRL